MLFCVKRKGDKYCPNKIMREKMLWKSHQSISLFLYSEKWCKWFLCVRVLFTMFDSQCELNFIQLKCYKNGIQALRRDRNFSFLDLTRCKCFFVWLWRSTSYDWSGCLQILHWYSRVCNSICLVSATFVTVHFEQNTHSKRFWFLDLCSLMWALNMEFELNFLSQWKQRNFSSGHNFSSRSLQQHNDKSHKSTNSAADRKYLIGKSRTAEPVDWK